MSETPLTLVTAHPETGGLTLRAWHGLRSTLELHILFGALTPTTVILVDPGTGRTLSDDQLTAEQREDCIELQTRWAILQNLCHWEV